MTNSRVRKTTAPGDRSTSVRPRGKGRTLPINKLKEYFQGRIQATRIAEVGQGDSNAETVEGLVREALRWVERALVEKLGNQHFELSVWTDAKEPRIIAYYDSTCSVRPRSDPQRRQNPTYYRDKRYAVINLLDHPSQQFVFVDRASAQSYHYIGNKQRKLIKSTFLYCFDDLRPAVLVATSDVPGSLTRESVSDDLIRALSLAIRGDLDLGTKLEARSAGGLASNCQGKVFSWLHISDIHFGAGASNHRFDQRKVCTALLRDAKAAPNPVDAIFVTGDIAFKAAKAEYTNAAMWLKELAAAAGVSEESIYLVPGNHDVNRSIADQAEVQAFHEQARTNARKLDDLLESVTARSLLAGKLEEYGSFIANNFPKHPSLADASSGDWSQEITLNADGKAVRLLIVGLSTVWVSDKLDGKAQVEDKTFTPNMLIGSRQLSAVFPTNDNSDVVIVLTHHPREWLMTLCKDELGSYLTRRVHVHLCGHIHQKDAGVSRHFGEKGQDIRLVAGATHNDEPRATASYHGEHGYSWGMIRIDKGNLKLGWAPRVYVPRLDAMRADRTRYELDEAGYAWEDLQRSSE